MLGEIRGRNAGLTSVELVLPRFLPPRPPLPSDFEPLVVQLGEVRALEYGLGGTLARLGPLLMR